MGRWILPLFFISGLFISCTNDMKEVMRLPGNQLRPTQVGDSVTMLYSDSSQLKIMVKANRMLVFTNNVKEPLTILPTGVYVTFFDRAEKVSATLRANYGVRYEQTKRMEAKYDVVVVNRNGEKLETEKLLWDEQAGKIYTDAPVRITTGREIIMGKGLESNQDFSRYEIKQVTGQIHLKQHES
jgi:LPS export ABC transporter protein LptC